MKIIPNPNAYDELQYLSEPTDGAFYNYFLRINQTTPQTIINGQPIFGAGATISAGYDLTIGSIGLNDTASSAAGCSLIGIPIITGATYNKQCDFNNSFGSVGRKSGGVVSDAGASYVAVTAGTGFIKATDDDNAELLSFNWAAPSNIEITDTETWIGVEYNSGVPQVVKKTAFEGFDLDTGFPLARVVRETVNGSVSLSVLNNPWWVTDGTTNVIERIRSEGYVVRDNIVGGLTISNPSTTKLAVTAGTLWSNLNEFDIPAINTADGDTFYYMWYSSTNGWQLDAAATDYSVLQWNDTTQATLQNLSANRFANIWIYACPCNGKIVLLYPQAQYTVSAQAEAENPPSLIPYTLRDNGILIGRMLIKQNVSAPLEIQSAFTTQFTPALAADHGNLAGLTDDDHAQYLLADGTRALSGNWDVGAFSITALNYISDVALGTQPYACTSTTLNTNLNADLWDGYQFSDYLDQAVKVASTPQFTRLGIGAAADADDELYVKLGSVQFNATADVYSKISSGAYIVTRTGDTNPALQTYISASGVQEAQPRYVVSISGKNSWGDGTNAVDTNIYRSAANVLKTDDAFEAASLDGAVEGKCIDVVRVVNEGIADNDTDTLVFDFVPSKIVLDYNMTVQNATNVCDGVNRGLCIVTITGTNTFTSTLDFEAIFWDARAAQLKTNTRHTVSDTTNVFYGVSGFTSASVQGSVVATATWTTSTKTLTVTYQETNTTTAGNTISCVATAYK